jgi:hypothetical protein
MINCHVYNTLDQLPQKNCRSIAQAKRFIKEFVARYEHQGYYSSRMQRYDLEVLPYYLKIIKSHAPYAIEND